MAGLFGLKPRNTRESDAQIVKKSKSKLSQPAITIKGGGSLLQRVNTACALVEKHLGKYREKFELITEEERLKTYIDKAVQNGILAIDTETNSLDPITTTLAGFSIYTPGEKAAYIPMNHISSVTGARKANQMEKDVAREQLLRLVKADTKLIMFNAKFDMRVLKQQLDLVPAGQNVINGDYILRAWYDGYLAAKCLNENEKAFGLKPLHAKYVLDDEKNAMSFEELFRGIPFTHVPIKTGYLYAANDALITYELYEYQQKFLDAENPECRDRDLQGVSNVFWNIEMPVVEIVCQMEDEGIDINLEYQQELSKKYNDLLAQKVINFNDIANNYADKIEAYKKRPDAVKIDSPINISSPQQIVALLYDIIGLEGHKKAPRSTEEKYIKDIKHPIIEALLEYREISKLLSTYIDKMAAEVNPLTGKIHCSFWQYGAVTGRFSSSEPNMQNIPAKNKDIRPMFTAGDDYVFLSSDYSKQEPGITAHMSKDKKMIQAFIDGNDVYSVIAALAFKTAYEDCIEELNDGTYYPEGAKRRKRAKAIVLGICYGKQIKSIAEDLGVSVKEAQEIYDTVMFEFPELEQFMKDSQNMARELGYVDTIFGRKRRLPNMQLEPYEFSWLNGVSSDFDALDFGSDESEESEIDQATKDYYIKQLNKAYGWKAKSNVIELAKSKNIKIVDNSGYIAEAERQCVNSRIQGSAADLTKLAMIEVAKCERLKELGFKLVLQVHDELIGKCPYENRKECAELLSACMVKAAEPLVVPLTCDVYVSREWEGKKVA